MAIRADLQLIYHFITEIFWITSPLGGKPVLFFTKIFHFPQERSVEWSIFSRLAASLAEISPCSHAAGTSGNIGQKRPKINKNRVRLIHTRFCIHYRLLACLSRLFVFWWLLPLCTLFICARVIISVALEKVDYPPNRKSGAYADNYDRKHIRHLCEKFDNKHPFIIIMRTLLPLKTAAATL